ncbi:MAG: hypothetical protein VKJ06_07675 [Vampirovibrionales bacterium]|nr:hypothetical protein [Vampirovibrionales bacterium]
MHAPQSPKFGGVAGVLEGLGGQSGLNGLGALASKVLHCEHFPMTAKLNPFKLKNLPFLLTNATIVRAAVGFARCYQDWMNPDPAKSKWDKRSEFWERVLGGEIAGTGMFMLALQLGQDLMAGHFERQPANAPQAFIDAQKQLSSPEKALLTQAIDKGFGGLKPDGLMERLFYKGYGLAKVEHHLNLTPQGKALLAKIEQPLNHYAVRLKMGGYKMFAAGAIASALFGGLISQLINEWVVARHAVPAINKRMGLVDPSQVEKQQQAQQNQRVKDVLEPFKWPVPPGLVSKASSLAINSLSNIGSFSNIGSSQSLLAAGYIPSPPGLSPAAALIPAVASAEGPR